MKPDQIDVIARTMLGDFEQIDHTEEARFNGQLVGNILNRDLLDGLDLDFTVLHPVPLTHGDFGALPDANATGYRSVTDSFPKTLGEDHEIEMSLTLATGGGTWGSLSGFRRV